MTQQFKNIQDSLGRGEGKTRSGLRAWGYEHHRLVGNLFMMVVLAAICLWVAYVASTAQGDSTIIENVVPEVNQSEAQVEKAVRSVSQ